MQTKSRGTSRKGLLGMGAMVALVAAAAPLASFEEPLKLSGTPTEQLARAFEKRLEEFKRAQARERKLFNDLNEFNRQAERLARATPDVDSLEKAIAAFSTTVDNEANAVTRRAATEKERSEARDALRKAEGLLREARSNVKLNSNLQVVKPPDKPTDKPDRSARPAEEKINDRKRQISANQKLIDDPDPRVSDDQKKILRETTIPRLEAEIRQIEATLKEKTALETQALERAKARSDRANAASDALSAPGASEAAGKWAKVLDAYEAAREALPEGSRGGLRELPRQGDEAAAGKAREAAAAIRQKNSEFERQRAALKEKMRATYKELCEVDKQLPGLAKNVAALQIAAANEAQRILEQLGAKETDDVMEEIKGLKEKMSEGKELLEKADGRLDKLEKVRGKVLGGRGAGIVDSVQERLGTVSKTLKFLGDATDAGLKIDQAMKDLNDPATSLKAISALLDAAGTAGESAPVIGPTVGAFLGFYAKAAGACCEAGSQIRDKKVEADIRILLGDHPDRADRHLYTEEEVASGGQLNNDDAYKKAAQALQARRLLSLVREASLAGSAGSVASGGDRDRPAPESPRSPQASPTKGAPTGGPAAAKSQPTDKEWEEPIKKDWPEPIKVGE